MNIIGIEMPVCDVLSVNFHIGYSWNKRWQAHNSYTQTCTTIPIDPHARMPQEPKLRAPTTQTMTISLYFVIFHSTRVTIVSLPLQREYPAFVLSTPPHAELAHSCKCLCCLATDQLISIAVPNQQAPYFPIGAHFTTDASNPHVSHSFS